MSGEDIHVAVAHKQGGRALCADLLHQGIQPGGIRFCGHTGPAAAHRVKAAFAEVMGNDLAAQRVGLVGEHRAPDAVCPQLVQKGGNAGIGGGFILLVGVVPGGEFGQRSGQLFRCAGIFRGKALHQFRDAVAHHVLELFHRKGGPAVLCAHPVARVGKIVDGVQQGAVQIK